ncbi:alginate O-acetyltransferase AlgF [uncultured Roseobacter sp.]|uniref:alginate O-acetyltransferase AlgF n=1 Tax=uncultured Roseobacter sp. TaxID=114847 RepID=UPI0026033374|nr:alginate O-acetyltransferase AlgF [uncultured Roseobacter sp.]
MKHSYLTALFLAAQVICATATASDTSLYPEAAPADASFVRFAGFDPDETAEFAGKSFALTLEDDLAYLPVSSALLNSVAPGTFVTIVRGADGHQQTILEGPRSHAARVHLFLINATERVLELRLADGSTPVIETVAAATAGARDVNPVAIALGVFELGNPIPLATFDVALKRGQNLSFIADDTGIRLVENRFGAVAR